MIRLVQKPAPVRPARRAWFVFFTDGNPDAWFARLFTRRGFRHVAAAAYFPDEERWVFVNPGRSRMVVEVRGPDTAGEIYDDLLARAHALLRVEARDERTHMPPVLFCSGAIKALLGIKSRALRPDGLFRDLVAYGAEIVPLPPEEHRGISRPENAAARPGGPDGEGAPRPGAAARGSGAGQGDAGEPAAAYAN